MADGALATSTAEWFTAVGTVGAVIFALLTQAAAPWWLRPKLLIPHGATLVPGDREDGTWWAIPIVNRGRGHSAIGAQAMLTHVTTPEGQALIALRSLKWTHLEDTARAELPAGIFRWVEFGRQPPKEPRVELGLHPRIDDPPRRHLEQEGKYTFYLALVAANATARNYSFVVTLGKGGDVQYGEIAAEPLRRRMRRAVATGIGLSRGLSGSRG